jgi:hypothetical protein
MSTERQFPRPQTAKLDSVEKRLSGIFRPIPPRKEFVNGLSHRIQSGERASFVNHLASWHFFAMLIAGLVSLVILVAVGVRALLELIEKKHPQLG